MIRIAADETNNMCKMSYEKCDKCLSENMTQWYRKEKQQSATCIVNECYSMAEQLHIDDRLRTTREKPAFIAIRDHIKNVLTTTQNVN